VVIGLSASATEVDFSRTDAGESYKQRKRERIRREEYRLIGQKITDSAHHCGGCQGAGRTEALIASKPFRKSRVTN
jgi:hypothetical protein